MEKINIEELVEKYEKYKDHNPKKSIFYAKKILDLSIRNNDFEKEGFAIQMIAQSYFNMNNFEECIKYSDKIIYHGDRFKGFESYRVANTLSANSYWRMGNIDMPVKFFLKAIELSKESSNINQLAKDQLDLGIFFQQRAEYNKSIKYTIYAYENFVKIDHFRGISTAFLNLGNNYYFLGNYEKALNYQNKAVQQAEKNNDSTLLGKSYNTISAIHKELGNFQKAIDFSLKSIKIKEKKKESLAPTYCNIGVFYTEWGKTEKGFEYYQRALQIEEKENNKPSISRVLNNIGNYLENKRDYKNALKSFKKALALKKEINDKKGITLVLANIGNIYIKNIKDYEKADKYLQEALGIAKEIKNIEQILSVSLTIVDLYCSNNKIEEAKILLKLCKKYLKEVNSYKLKIDYYERSISYHKLKKNYKKANQFYELLLQLKGKIFTEENQNTIKDLQTKYEIEKKENEAENYRLKSIELSIKNSEIQKQKEELEKTLDELNRSNLKFNVIEEELSKNYQSEFIGKSPQIKGVIDLISIVAKSSKTNVVITGESGTGKEIVARMIHKFSERNKKSFYGINSSAIPDSLFESQFFGHEKNSFTGADKTHIGWFEFADKGTLFLDEIATMSMEQQVKLLRVLEERKIFRLGSHKEIPVDVRIVSASNLDLFDLIEKGNFRKDLYYRLATFVIHIPPLRDRKEDIGLLLEHFVKLFSTQLNKRIKRIEKSIERDLNKYDFPGNVRELKSMVERAVLVANSATLKSTDFIIPGMTNPEKSNDTLSSISDDNIEVTPLKELEKEYIIKILKATDFNQTKTAELLAVERRVIGRKILKYGIKK